MKRLILATVVLILLIGPAGTVLAEPFFDTIVDAGETISNDVIVLDGDLEIQNGANVNGDVIVFNGDAVLNGTINGDMVIFNGNAALDGTINGELVIFNGGLDAGEGAAIHGDCVLLNGGLDSRSSSAIRCTNIEGATLPGFVMGMPPMPAVPSVPEDPDLRNIPDVPRTPPVPETRGPSRAGNAFADFMRTIASSLLLGGLAFVVASAFPNNLHKVKTTLRRKPVAAGAVGFLTAMAVPIVVAILAVISAVLTIICIGLLGFPIILLILLAFVAAILMGWVAAGTWLGERFFRGNDRSLAMKAAVGTFILTFAIGLLGILTGGWLEGLLGIVITSIGLGAVALTQFGRRPYLEHEEPAAGEDPDKVSIVLDTLPDEDAEDPILKL